MTKKQATHTRIPHDSESLSSGRHLEVSNTATFQPRTGILLRLCCETTANTLLNSKAHRFYAAFPLYIPDLDLTPIQRY